VGFADHLPALAHRRFQPVQFAHGILLARRLGQGRCDPGRQCTSRPALTSFSVASIPAATLRGAAQPHLADQQEGTRASSCGPRASRAPPGQATNQHDAAWPGLPRLVAATDSRYGNSGQRSEAPGGSLDTRYPICTLTATRCPASVGVQIGQYVAPHRAVRTGRFPAVLRDVTACGSGPPHRWCTSRPSSAVRLFT